MFRYIKEIIIPAILFTLMLAILMVGSEAFFGDLP